MGEFVLVTGAARSGKSSFAEKLAASLGSHVAYIATAQAFDQEMEDRIKLHRSRRPASWLTIEEPLAVPEILMKYRDSASVILLDCVTLWLSNLLMRELGADGEPAEDCQHRILSRVQDLAEAACLGQATLICVSNEVGWGLVPENKLGRLYRDLAGKANQVLAGEAGRVYLVVAGYPIEIKAAGSRILTGLED